MSIPIIMLLAAVVVAAATAGRWARTDGGLRHSPPPRAEDEWSSDLPSHRYGALW